MRKLIESFAARMIRIWSKGLMRFSSLVCSFFLSHFEATSDTNLFSVQFNSLKEMEEIWDVQRRKQSQWEMMSRSISDKNAHCSRHGDERSRSVFIDQIDNCSIRILYSLPQSSISVLTPILPIERRRQSLVPLSAGSRHRWWKKTTRFFFIVLWSARFVLNTICDWLNLSSSSSSSVDRTTFVDRYMCFSCRVRSSHLLLFFLDLLLMSII